MAKHIGVTLTCLAWQTTPRIALLFNQEWGFEENPILCFKKKRFPSDMPMIICVLSVTISISYISGLSQILAPSPTCLGSVRRSQATPDHSATCRRPPGFAGIVLPQQAKEARVSDYAPCVSPTRTRHVS